MATKKYTLPRHTNLAKNSTRTGAFLVDLAIGVLLTIGFVFALFRPIFKSKIVGYESRINKARLESGLYVKKDDGTVDTLDGAKEYDYYMEPLQNFYFNYMKSELIPESDRHDYTVEWFNKEVLNIGKTNEYQCFKYVEEGGVEKKDVLGVLIVDEDEQKNKDIQSNASKMIQKQYKIAVQVVFNNISSVAKVGADLMFLSTIIYSASILLAGVVSYIVVPLFFKNGQTIGKKIFKLGLADSDGYMFHNYKLLMRFMPFAVVDASLILLVAVNLYIVLSIVVIIFLVSFTLAMASPKRMSLHDFTAQTIVIDYKTSKIFSSVEEEEKYVLREDHLLDDVMPEATGEEPELKYEK